MARPALSASRSMDVLDFLSAFPGQGFTLSEIARATRINVSSCHSVLNALTENGYLSRGNDQKYALGPALVAVGRAAFKSQPLLERAQGAAEKLARDLKTPVLLTSLIGDQILALAAISNPSGRAPSMRVGQRMPLVPPVGAPFLAWASADEIDAWVARMAPAGDDAFVEDWRRAMALIRKRGFQVTLRVSGRSKYANVMTDMASSRNAPNYKDHVVDLIHSWDERLFHPKSIDDAKRYDVALIAAPLFDENGRAAFSLCLVEFAERMTGAGIKDYADRLVQTCVQIMRRAREAS